MGIFLIFLNTIVCCVFWLELPRWGDPNEYIQYTIFNIKITYPKSAAIGFCSKGLKMEFETAVVNKPSVFEPLKVYCMNFIAMMIISIWATVVLTLAYYYLFKYLGPVVQN